VKVAKHSRTYGISFQGEAIDSTGTAEASGHINSYHVPKEIQTVIKKYRYKLFYHTIRQKPFNLQFRLNCS
jgi:hypothetical protein